MLEKEVPENSIDRPMFLRGASAGSFIRTNRAFSSLTGYEAEDLAQKPLADWIAPEDRAALQALLEAGSSCTVKHLSHHGTPVSIELRRQDNGIILGLYPSPSTSPIEGDPEATVSSTLHAIARIIEEQNPGYKCSILLVADGHFVRGAGPSLSEDYNSAIDGFAIGPAVGSCGTAIYWNVPVIVEDIQNDPLWIPFRELAAKEGVAACWSHPFTSKGGSVLGALAFYSPEPRKPTEQQLSALRAAARMTGLAMERGRAEQALREKRKRELELEDQLRQAAKMEALGVLAGGVAHDFNNVLSTILSNAEYALDVLPEDHEVRPELEAIIEASKRAGSFCSQMLAYAGRGAFKTTLIEMGSLLPQLSSLVSAAVPKKATLEYSLHNDELYVDGDENQLLQVFMNLVTNAAEALGDYGGRILVSTSLEEHDKNSLERFPGGEDCSAGSYFKLTVSDTGCGMSPEVASRIFAPFYTTKFTGRGLGLAAVKGIILKHGGVINLHSVEGKGTTFTVMLPAAEPPRKKAACGADSRAQRQAGRRLLVVDDEENLRQILCKRLRRAGFEVLEAAEGQSALELFKESPEAIDCVLLDLSMPKLGGDEVLMAIREVQPDTPVIMMSGYTEQEMIDRFESQISGALQKPFTKDLLMAAIDNATANQAPAYT